MCKHFLLISIWSLTITVVSNNKNNLKKRRVGKMFIYSQFVESETFVLQRRNTGQGHRRRLLSPHR